VEEVMRIYGYDNIDVSRHFSWTAFNAPLNHDLEVEKKVSEILVGFGFNEMMNLSLSREQYYGDTAPVKVLNPLSNELSVLRADMLYSGLETILYNVNRKSTALKLFEIGKTYHLKAGEKQAYKEKKHLAVFLTGSLFGENAHGLRQEADLSFLRSVVNGIFLRLGITKYNVKDSTDPLFDYGLSVFLNTSPLAEMGAVSSKKLKAFDLKQPVMYALINWQILVQAASRQKTEYQEISKFPAVRRDLALLIDKSVKYQQIEELAFASEKKFLQEVNLFDIYENDKLGNKRSYAVSFTLANPEATLTDKQIDAVMEKLISNYREKLGAELR
jgi:phenylalanyl-tRNA synthetase beta chain